MKLNELWLNMNLTHSPWHVAACLSHDVSPPLEWGYLLGSRSSPPLRAYLSAPAMCRLLTQASRKGNPVDRNTKGYHFSLMGGWQRRRERMQGWSNSSLPHTTLGSQPPLFQGSSQTSTPRGLNCKPHGGKRLQCRLPLCLFESLVFVHRPVAVVCVAVGWTVGATRTLCPVASLHRGAAAGSQSTEGLCWRSMTASVEARRLPLAPEP